MAHADSRLQLVTAGPDQVGWQTVLQQQAAALGIAERSGELKWGAFRCAEHFCLPSHQESFGIVVVEALARSLPVAIAEPVNIWTEVAAARAGLMHADTAVGITGALLRWLTLHDGEKQQIGERGEEMFRKRFDFASVAPNLLPVLEAAIQQQPVRLTP